MKDPNGVAHAAFGYCVSTQYEVPKIDRRTGQATGTEWADGRRPCGQIGTLEAFEMDEPWEVYTAVYWCPMHR